MNHSFSRVLLFAAAIVVVAVSPVFATGGDTSTDQAYDTSEFVTISNYMFGAPPENGEVDIAVDLLNEKFAESINAEMELQWIEWTDYMSKYGLLLASGQPVDLITTGEWLEVWNNVRKGAFHPLTDLISTYAPNTWAAVSQDEWDAMKVDGEIYTLPENNLTNWTNHGVMYRGDWADEFGIDEINDLDDLEEYFQAVKDNKEAFPIDIGAEFSAASFYLGWFWSKTEWFPMDPVSYSTDQMVWASGYDSLEDVVCPVFDPLYIEYAQTMKRWADAGYWRRDAMNFSGSNPIQGIKEGTSGAAGHHTMMWSGNKTAMERELGGDFELSFLPYSAPMRNLNRIPITMGAQAIGRTSENPERSLMMYDLLVHDREYYDLINYGVEGKNYHLNEDGKLYYPADYDWVGDVFYTSWWGGRHDDLAYQSADTPQEVLDMYDELSSYAKLYPYTGFIFDAEPIELELSAITQVISQFGLPINFGIVDDPEAAVAEYREKLLGAGIERVLEEASDQITAWQSSK